MPAWFNYIYLIPIVALTPLVAAALTRVVGNMLGIPRTVPTEAAFGAMMSLGLLLVVVGGTVDTIVSDIEIALWSEFYQPILFWALGCAIATPTVMIVGRLAVMAFNAVIAGVDRVWKPR